MIQNIFHVVIQIRIYIQYTHIQYLYSIICFLLFYIHKSIFAITFFNYINGIFILYIWCCCIEEDWGFSLENFRKYLNYINSAKKIAAFVFWEIRYNQIFIHIFVILGMYVNSKYCFFLSKKLQRFF